MKLRKLIEMLAKQNWNAEVKMDFRKELSPTKACTLNDCKNIKSISSFRSKGKPIVLLTIRSI